MCLAAPKIPKVPAPTPPPTMQSTEVVAARTREKQRLALMAGRASTISTGPSGAAGGSVLYKTLLGS